MTLPNGEYTLDGLRLGLKASVLLEAAKAVDHYTLVILSAVNFDQRDSLEGVSVALRNLRTAVAQIEAQP